MTEYEYDTWNRIKTLTYPDGEVLTYNYDLGGKLISLQGVKNSFVMDYIIDIGRNEYEERRKVVYGNGTQNLYQYDDMRRLSNLRALRNSETYFHNVYTYDDVGNITSLTNNSLPSNDIGGTYQYNYDYDNLNRLISADGSHENSTFANDFTLDMEYNNVGSITNKDQEHERGIIGGPNGVFVENTFDYSYILDATEFPAHAPSDIGPRKYTYDNRGNTINIKDNSIPTYRNMIWDPEDNMRGMADSESGTAIYTYDHAGQRVVKSIENAPGINVNGAPSTAITDGMDKTVFYAGSLMTLSRNKTTKHYFVNGQRIASRVGKGSLIATPPAANGLVNYAGIIQETNQALVDDIEEMGVNVMGVTWNTKGFYTGSTTTYENLGSTAGASAETEVYFFHPDHLGSSSLLTDKNGDPYQHFSFLPFGETLAEYSVSLFTEYKFNSKELDEQTGFYYYGARYYDPKVSLWLSVDPLADKYPSLSPYTYVANYNTPQI